MSTRSLGSLTIDLVAKIGGFTQGMTAAERAADRSARNISQRQKKAAKDTEQAWSNATRYISGAFAGLSIAGLMTSFIRESVNASNEQAQLAAALKSTGEAAGFSAQQLNAMAASMSSNSIFSEGDINKAQTRLLAYTNVVGEQFPQAMQAVIDMSARLGMSVEQSAETIGKALDVPSEGLSALSRQGFRFTEEQKKAVEQLEKTGQTAKAQAIVLSALESSYGGAAAAARDTLGGALIALQEQFRTLITGSDGSVDGMKSAVEELIVVLKSPEVKAAFDTLGTLIANTIGLLVRGGAAFLKFGKDVGEGLAIRINGDDTGIRETQAEIEALQGSMQRTFSSIERMSEALRRDPKNDFLAGRIENARKKLAEYQRQAAAASDRLKQTADVITQGDMGPPASAAGGGGGRGAPDAAEIKRLAAQARAREAAARDAAASLKKQHDNEIAALQRSVEEQSRLLSERNKFLDLFNGLGLLSIEEYYQRQANIRDEATEAQVKAYDAQIKALRDFQAKAPKGSERLEVEGKINDLLEKQANLQREAGSAAIVAGLEQARAAKEYQDSINDVNASILEMTGYLKEAAAIRFDKQIEGLAKSVAANGSADDKAALDRYRQLTIAQAEFGDKAKDIATINETLRMQEERVALSRQLGFDGEMSSLAKLGEARREAVTQLEAIVLAQEAIARASENPVLVRNAEQARLALDQLAATVDPLAERFNTMFADSASNAFGDFISGAKSAKEAFTDFINDIISQLASMIARDMFKQLFSGIGGGGGGGLDFGSMLAGLFSGGRAAGGAVTAGNMYRVNENGPEMLEMNGQNYLMMGSRSGNVSASGARPMNVVNNFTVSGQVDRGTQMQIAQRAGSAIQRATARNG